MNTSKLREALVELQHERATLDSIISQLQRILASVNSSDSKASSLNLQVAQVQESYIDLAVDILGHAGKPMHVNDITSKISELRKKKATSMSVNSSLVRHIKGFGTRAKIAKFGPSTYGLPAWKNLIPQSSSAA